ncbi:MAG: DUF1761 domain-containing protein [Flavobacteriales bacterium]|nr:DUF1761 domain-containing protein [Flavobacteriales bacterium]MCB9205667.1 DUF1761 domain-containing protein [Flavobacteriales bacterium]
MNFPVILGAALIPTIIGFIWYNPKVFGNAWMKASGVTEDMIKTGNMPVIFGVSLLLSVMLSISMISIVIHQIGVQALFQGDTDPANLAALETFMDAYGDRFRSFGHGALHGTIAGIFFVLPVLGTNALFERKGFKYIAINASYWTLTLALMGGVICQFS